MLRYYRVDLLDFYRGTLSFRRLAVLVRQLPAESAVSRALNGGRPPLSRTDHVLMDLWALIVNRGRAKGSKPIDHPVRAEIQAKARSVKKLAKVAQLKSKFDKRRRTYGLG